MSVKTSTGIVVLKDEPADDPAEQTLEEGKGEELEEGKEAAGTEVSAEPSKGSTRRERMMKEYSALKPFAIISSSYLLFTITDGGLRMIVLLHAYNLGFTVRRRL